MDSMASVLRAAAGRPRVVERRRGAWEGTGPSTVNLAVRYRLSAARPTARKPITGETGRPPMPVKRVCSLCGQRVESLVDHLSTPAGRGCPETPASAFDRRR